jgi:predicted GIY-YIG superfamily endonuclease
MHFSDGLGVIYPTNLSSLLMTAIILSLLNILRQYRTDQAYQRAVPPAAVFSNKLLSSIVSARPTTLTSLLKIHGIGPTRCSNYGRDIVRFVNLESKRTKCEGKLTKKVKILKKTKGKPQIVTSRFFPPINPTVTISPTPKTDVYVLELEDGRVYVGSSKDVPKRISQHAAGSGSAYTRMYRPTGVRLPRLGNVEGEGDAAERDETLRYMMVRGIQYVRGWKFVRVDMPSEESDEAEANIRELFDLCRKCGGKGHFCTRCKATIDRLGNFIHK